MQLLENLSRWLCRFRYPVSSPEDLGRDLGIKLSNTLSFEDMIAALACPKCRPTTIKRWMSRKGVEASFQSALKKEIFHTNSLFSYYFNEGWVVLALYFDECSRLRRLYLQCPAPHEQEGFDLTLHEELHPGKNSPLVQSFLYR